MHQKITALVLAALLALGLTACAQPAAEETQPAPIPETVPETTLAQVTAEPVIPEEPNTDARMAAYRLALEQFVYEHTLPDGSDIGFDSSFGFIESNSFAIADVDGDREEELILSMTSAPMAGMCQWIFGYDNETGQLYQELAIFPSTVFYTGGLVQADWSHNQGLGGEQIWPYTLLGYDPTTRTYSEICQVDSWDASRGVEYNGEPFPAELDSDGVGTVFFVTTGDETVTMSKADYDAWRAELFGCCEIIEPEFRNTTQDNIRAVCPD